jgi:stalled ribosome rescue protein Dom34
MELPDWLQNVNSALLDADAAITSNANEWTVEEACDLLAQLNSLKAAFGTVYDTMAHVASEKLGDMPEITTSDGSKIEKKVSSTRRGWQHKNLATAVAERLSNMSVDMDTGEIVMTPQELAEKMLDYVQPSYWRLRELDSIGINADMYCEVGDAKESIIVRKAKK